MVDRPLRYVWGTVREGVFANLIWGLGATALFVLIQQMPGRTAAGFEGPLWARWLEWVAGFYTFDWGYSPSRAGPVDEAVWPAAGHSVVLLAMIGIVVAVAVLLARYRLAGRDRLHPAVLAPAYVASSVPPLFWLLGYKLAVGWTGASMPIGLRSVPGPADDWPLVAAIGLAFAVPVVGHQLRRHHRADPGSGRGPIGGLGPDDLRLASADGWLVVSYLVGNLLVVESIVGLPGLGRLVLDAVAVRDLPLAMGATGVLLLLLVWLLLVRNLVWMVGQVAVHSSGGPRRSSGSRATTDGGHPHTNGRTRLGPVWSRPRVLAGGGGFVGLLVAGLVGSALLSPEPVSFTSGHLVAIGPGHVLNSLSTVVVVMLVATAVAGVAVLLGLVARRFRGPVETALRFAHDVTAVWPLLLAGVLLAMAFGMPGDRLGFELRFGVLAGVLLAPAVFMATSGVVGPREGGDGVPLGGAALSRSVESLALAGFVTAELVYVGFGTPQGVALTAVFQLNRVVPYPTNPGRAALALGLAVLVVALPALCLNLLADGLAGAGQPRGSASRATSGTDDGDEPSGPGETVAGGTSPDSSSGGGGPGDPPAGRRPGADVSRPTEPGARADEGQPGRTGEPPADDRPERGDDRPPGRTGGRRTVDRGEGGGEDAQDRPGGRGHAERAAGTDEDDADRTRDGRPGERPGDGDGDEVGPTDSGGTGDGASQSTPSGAAGLGPRGGGRPSGDGPTEQSRRCQHCGADVRPGSAYCPTCGERL